MMCTLKYKAYAYHYYTTTYGRSFINPLGSSFKLKFKDPLGVHIQEREPLSPLVLNYI